MTLSLTIGLLIGPFTTAGATCRLRDMTGLWDMSIASVGANPTTLLRCRLVVGRPAEDGQAHVNRGRSRCEDTRYQKVAITEGRFRLRDRKHCEWVGSVISGPVATRFLFRSYKRRDIVIGETIGFVDGERVSNGSFQAMRVRKR